MTRALIAGVGNVLYGDDGFGVEVARRLGASPPPDAVVGEFGIRAIHLAMELLTPVELCVVADCMTRGGPPGTLYVVDPEPEAPSRARHHAAHGMNLGIVFAVVRGFGGQVPRTVVIGCEPHDLTEHLGLSPVVADVVPAAIELVREVLAEYLR